MAVLEAQEISVSFGGHLAVDTLSLSVDPGSITGLIGPNGAGKTTTFNVLTGLLAPTRGRVLLAGSDVTDEPAFRRARYGMARTFQRLELFGSLTVRDNVLTAAELAEGSGDAKPSEIAEALIERVGVSHLADYRADALSTGNARLVELARALASSPQVLLLDEPASGLDEAETERFAELLVELASDGLGILLVEHDVPLVMKLCKQIYVMNFGRLLAQGTPQQVQQNEAVIDAYLGQGSDVGAIS